MQAQGLSVGAGDFAENLTTAGLELHRLPIGTQLRVGGGVTLEITQIGKECHSDCEIKRLTGKCIMPTEGVFAAVLVGGEVRAGDEIEALESHHEGRHTDGK
jgi:MOSC domain-containing protein YiiM